ncbi:MAG TPA: orotate phosphoribosyltransferase [Syntrophorhabdaceae bacterium]|nr:orotate phosphoribosyltransferase [Syntrophorhabdaceae bacterium]
MERYKEDFIEFMLRADVLRFGEFVTKSGRKTPFFINTGSYRTGSQIEQLGDYYAQAIVREFGFSFDVIFGPAYKGIPLAVAAVSSLYRLYGRDLSYCFNRKEIKDHGEGGALIGAKLQPGDRVLIIEDVTTAGTSIKETVPVLTQAADIKLSGLIVSVDRQERGQGTMTALKEIEETYGMKTASIVNMREVRTFLLNRAVDGKTIIDATIDSRIEDYYRLYGASS